MKRKLSFWQSRPTRLAKNRRRRTRARHSHSLRTTDLGVESLEGRLVLSANLAFDSVVVTPDTMIDEGGMIDIDVAFTDVVPGGGGGGPTIGLNPNDSTFDSIVEPAVTASLAAPIHFNTSNLTFSGGAAGNGMAVGVDITGDSVDDFEIAVFVFADFQLPDLALFDAEVTADGDRPLAILSRSNMVIAGTIDVSARQLMTGDPELDGLPGIDDTGDILGTNAEVIAGPGGGNGGIGGLGGLDDPVAGVIKRDNGKPAAGAPDNGPGRIINDVGGVLYSNAGGGHGGAFGGFDDYTPTIPQTLGLTGQGGRGERSDNTNPPNALNATNGQPYGDLSKAIQGGSGGSTGQIDSITGPQGLFSGGGGGGGGIELGAVGSITIALGGQVLADGGDAFNPGGAASGGGGGAGGGILIHANSVTHNGELSAKGGKGGLGGGKGGGGGGGGAILIVHSGGYTEGMSAIRTVAGGLPGADGTAGIDGTNSVELASSGSTPIIETFTYSINWGDGSTPDSGDATANTDGAIDDPVEILFSGVHTYDDDGVYTVSMTVTSFDENENVTGTVTETFDITVNNVDPTAVLANDGPVDEGFSATVSFSGQFDPSSDDTDAGFRYAYDFDNDGTWEIGDGNYGGSVAMASAAVPATFLSDGPGSRTVKARILDKDGGSTDYTTDIAVDNVAPTALLGNSGPVDEGSSATVDFSGQFDPSSDDTNAGFRYAYDFDNDGTWDEGDGTYGGSVATASAAMPASLLADGTVSLTVAARILDKDGGFNDYTTELTVNNVAPTADAGGPYLTFDDVPITLNGTGFDVAGALDPLTFEWDLDDNGTFETSGANPVFDALALGLVGTQARTVHLRVSDGDGGITTVSTTVDMVGEGSVLIDGVLYVVGDLTGNDQVIISSASGNINVSASFHGTNPMQFDSLLVDEIHVRLRGGHDVIVTTPSVTAPMTIEGGDGNDLLNGGGGRNVIYGENGNDILIGGAADDVLLGGPGNDDLLGAGGDDVLVGGDGSDILIGSQGRDVVIGSEDEDLLVGGVGEDILIGGVTAHDDNVAALDAIMDIWGSTASFNSRIATLTGSGGLLEAGVAVFDDEDTDLILGGAGRDLVFGDTNPWDGSVDLMLLNPFQDVLVAI